MTQLQKHLRTLLACGEATIWAGNRTAQQTWEECHRADWLLWWAARTSVNSKQDIVRVSCAVARLALKFIPEGELRPLKAIEAAENWANHPTEDNRKLVLEARRAAWDFRAAAGAAAAGAAAAAAAHAADAAGAGAAAAAHAADAAGAGAAYAAAHAADAAYAAAAGAAAAGAAAAAAAHAADAAAAAAAAHAADAAGAGAAYAAAHAADAAYAAAAGAADAMKAEILTLVRKTLRVPWVEEETAK